jgi:uncharacterized membrane protein (DUF4010 family)
MPEALDVGVIRDFAIALLIGALIGVEREKRIGVEREKSKSEDLGGIGLRTFILFALVGAAAGFLSRGGGVPWVLLAAFLPVSALLFAGYWLVSRAQDGTFGLTTEIAAVAVFLFGAMTMLGHRELAIGLGVVTAAVLAYKQPLHGLVAKLGWDDVYAGVRLLIATFIILPLLPDRTLDPWEALNPYKLWLLVILISSLSLVGYVATRWLGPGRGTALTGITGGLVSSTAVTLSFARRSRDEPAAGATLACGILLAWAVMFGRVLVLVLAVNFSLVYPLVLPFAAMGLLTFLAAWLLYRRSGATAGPQDVQLQNPFSLTAAVQFALVFAAVLLLVKLTQFYFPGGGVYIVAALAGLTDVDAITLSMAEYAKGNSPTVAAIAVVIASISNTVVKCGMVATLGGPALRRPILLATAGIILAGIGGVAAMAWLRQTASG